MSDKYQKIFRHKLVVRSKKETELVIKTFGSPTLVNWHDILTDFIEIARKRQKNKFAMFRLQMAILGDIVTLNNAIKQYLKLLNDPKEPRKWIPEPEPIDEFHFDNWKRELETHKILLSALRDIGDGIAWRVLKYNRPLLYILSLNASPCPIQFNQGLLSEMYALSDITYDADISEFFIHAITNVARIGDITSVSNIGEVDFVEVKSKDKGHGIEWKERIHRQIIRSDNLIKIANEGIGLADKKGITVRIFDVKPEVTLKEYRSLIVEAKGAGIGSRVLNCYQAVIATDMERPISDGIFDRRAEEITNSISNIGDKVFHFTSLNMFEFSPARAPLTIFPFDADDIASLLLGRIIFYFAFNFTRFLTEFEKTGWKVLKSFVDNPLNYNSETDHIITIRKGNLTIEIPPSFLARAVFEGLSIKSILFICEKIKEVGPISSQGATVPGFAKEELLWN